MQSLLSVRGTTDHLVFHQHKSADFTVTPAAEELLDETHGVLLSCVKFSSRIDWWSDRSEHETFLFSPMQLFQLVHST